MSECHGVMLYVIASVLIFLWLLGLLTMMTFDGYIHILLVAAIVCILLALISEPYPEERR